MPRAGLPRVQVAIDAYVLMANHVQRLAPRRLATGVPKMSAICSRSRETSSSIGCARAWSRVRANCSGGVSGRMRAVWSTLWSTHIRSIDGWAVCRRFARRHTASFSVLRFPRKGCALSAMRRRMRGHWGRKSSLTLLSLFPILDRLPGRMEEPLLADVRRQPQPHQLFP